jgi:hypothetical protein
MTVGLPCQSYNPNFSEKDKFSESIIIIISHPVNQTWVLGKAYNTESCLGMTPFI